MPAYEDCREGSQIMATFRVNQCRMNTEANGFDVTGTLVEGDLAPGMFLRVWINMMLYYPYRIATIGHPEDSSTGELRLTFESEIGEECLIQGMDLCQQNFHVSSSEPCLDL